jgi:Holliday junction resolvase RusA-like endonuclease
MLTLDLPYPPSVNRIRRVNWAARPDHNEWVRQADKLVLYHRVMQRGSIPAQYQATLLVNEKSGGVDLDNLPKSVIDYARRLGLVKDDSPRYLRRVVAEFGEAPEGCRLILTPL